MQVNFNQQIEKWAMNAVINYERSKKRKIVDVSKNKHFVGVDLISMKKDESEARTIEVKGTTRSGSINFSETELTSKKRLIASHLYIVLFPDESKKKSKGKIIEIKREEIQPEDFTERTNYTLSSQFVNHKISNAGYISSLFDLH